MFLLGIFHSGRTMVAREGAVPGAGVALAPGVIG